MKPVPLVASGALWLTLFVVLTILTGPCKSNAPTDIRMDEKARTIHRIDSINILIYTVLLILTVCLIWAFKRRRARFLHETGLAVIFGLMVGATIRYLSDEKETSHLFVVPAGNVSAPTSPPDNVFIQLEIQKSSEGTKGNRSYAYTFRGELTDVESKKLDQKATFDPEVFFNIILPPIIFNAGYSLKRKFFFRNLGTIMTYAFFGTTISCFVVGCVLYVFTLALPHLAFTFNNCLYFGAIISATDPVTVLAIFHDLHVDVNLYALVFGESILNDAVAIGLVAAITDYETVTNKAPGEFELGAAVKAFGSFFYIFAFSFLIGSCTGCVTALITKFTKLCDFPLLESCLFLLMSYSSFLVAEALDLTGIVAVLFCGICQAHYTYNNLSPESRQRTKQLFELMNFVAENFIFSYIGVSMFTYKKHHWDLFFILAAFIAIAAGRALFVYPLTFLLNLGRTNKIPMAFQHVLFFSGLRGAMAFALAIRNTLGLQRHVMLTTTSFIVIVSVVVCGGSTSNLLRWLNIPVGSEDHDQELLNITAAAAAAQAAAAAAAQQHHQQQAQPTTGSMRPGDPRSPMTGEPLKVPPYEKAWLVRKWYNFDVRFMKPLLTHSRPTLIETLPSCCLPIAHLLTSTEQLTQHLTSIHPNVNSDDNCRHARDDDSDTDLCLDESDFNFERTNSLAQASQALANHVYYIEK